MAKTKKSAKTKSRKSKPEPEIVQETNSLNEKLMDEFADELEKGINRICSKNSKTDPRLELLVTLGIFAAQVGQDSGFETDEFLNLMADLYHKHETDCPHHTKLIDKSQLN